MGRYVSWELDVIQRFNGLSDIGSSGVNSSDISGDATLINTDSAYVHYAELEIENRLSGGFTTPFSSNNLTVKDLAIDETYRRVVVFKDKGPAKSIGDSIDVRIRALLDGTANMITSSAEAVSAVGVHGNAKSTTEDYHPVFGLGDVELFDVSSAQLQDEVDARR